MSNQLPMAINPSLIPYSECNFVGFDLEGQHHPLLSKFIVETNHKVFGSDIVLMLGISHEWCTNYIGGEQNYIKCQLPPNGVNGYLNCIWGITYDQLMMMWAKAKNTRADKYKPILAELIETQVLPLFNEVKLVAVKPEVSSVTITNNQPLTMSSQEIADLLGCRHDSVKRTMERLQDKRLISFTQTEESTKIGFPPMVENSKSQGGRPKILYHVNKRDSYVVVAQLSPEFTAKLVDRWQELETQVAHAVSPARVEIKTDHSQPSKQVNASFLKIAIAQIDMMNLPAERKQILKAHLMHEQAGLPLDLMLPVVYEEKLSPAQIALRMNVSAQAIGHIISKLGIRGNETYCEPRLSYVERSNRDVIVHFYNNQAVNMIKQALKDKQNEKKN